MSEENVEIVRRGFATLQGGDLSEHLALSSDDLVTYRAEPDAATYHGKDRYLQAVADWVEGFTEWTMSGEEFIDAGDRVVVRVHQSARGEASAAPVG
jgi:ketosteroid isomerase-like protein